MAAKIQLSLILLLSAVSVVISCLVTNCPRGGKRGKPDFRVPPEEAVSSGLIKCKLCSFKKENCLGADCDSKVSCGEEGHCISREICCSKRLCEVQKSCERDFKLGKPEEFQLSSLLLTKIFRYNV